MAYTGTEGYTLSTSTTSVNSLILKNSSVPFNFNLNADELLNTKIKDLENQINVLKNLIDELSNQPKGAIETGTIQPYAGSAIDMNTYTILPPPSGYAWCFGEIVSKTDEKYSALYDVIGDHWNTSETLTDDQFQLPDLRDVFLRGCTTDNPESTNYRVVGNLQECGAPEIWGKAIPSAGSADTIQCNFEGGFAANLTVKGAGCGSYSSGSKPGFDFYASRCSSVYQSGLTEIRPKNKAVNYIIKL